MQEMLKVARDSIKRAQDCARTYADTTRRQVTFTEGDRVFLKVPERSETMSTESMLNFHRDIVDHSQFSGELVLLPIS